jgi:hypothetical protein
LRTDASRTCQDRAIQARRHAVTNRPYQACQAARMTNIHYAWPRPACLAAWPVWERRRPLDRETAVLVGVALLRRGLAGERVPAAAASPRRRLPGGVAGLEAPPVAVLRHADLVAGHPRAAKALRRPDEANDACRQARALAVVATVAAVSGPFGVGRATPGPPDGANALPSCAGHPVIGYRPAAILDRAALPADAPAALFSARAGASLFAPLPSGHCPGRWQDGEPAEGETAQQPRQRSARAAGCEGAGQSVKSGMLHEGPPVDPIVAQDSG